MSMPQPNYYDTYKHNQVQTANPGELLLLLYDRAVLLTKQAKRLIDEGRPGEAHLSLVKTQDIITELMVTLDFEAGEIAHQLYALYDYMKYRLVQANIKKDGAGVAEVGGMLAELRETWAQIARSSRKK